MTFLEIFDMYVMIFDIFNQYLLDFVNIWSIFGHVLGNWAQGLAWGGDLVCHAAWAPRGIIMECRVPLLLISVRLVSVCLRLASMSVRLFSIGVQ